MKPLPHASVFLLAFAAVFVLLVAVGAYRLGPYGWEWLTTVQKIGVFASLAASAALLGFSLVRQMVPGSHNRMPPLLVPVAAFVLVLLVMSGLFEYMRHPNFLRAGISCLQAGLPYGIPAALIFWILLSRGAVLSPLATGATAGALAGLVGVTVLEVHCANHDLLHIISFHLGVLVIGAGTGLLFGAAGRIFSSYYRDGKA